MEGIDYSDSAGDLINDPELAADMVQLTEERLGEDRKSVV